ncbi:LytTR family DNA-binding domain-containing protein [Flavobacterium sp.]|uniref:LytR/AlgR family response regulator transcription factor n=1 Tax=Flavobacterium sp. TaxID=239 RepID=UPI00286B1890|nr:LytTR family DNA-binding domain-containing protein [Flavobacterium sp.]
MLRTIVIEDEDLIRKMIVNMVKNMDAVNFIGEASSVYEGVILADATQPDLILLDIQLRDGNGFTLYEKLKTKPKVIFITAYDDYGIRAIRLGALDYILKPIDEEELEMAIQKVFQQSQYAEQFTATALAMNGQANKLFLRTQEGLHILKMNDILYCHGEGSYTQFFIKNGSKIMVSKPLKEYESMLPEQQFARCHQSYIVNLNEVTRIDKSDLVIMSNEAAIPISTRKKKWFIDSFFSS